MYAGSITRPPMYAYFGFHHGIQDFIGVPPTPRKKILHLKFWVVQTLYWTLNFQIYMGFRPCRPRRLFEVLRNFLHLKFSNLYGIQTLQTMQTFRSLKKFSSSEVFGGVDPLQTLKIQFYMGYRPCRPRRPSEDSRNFLPVTFLVVQTFCRP